MEVHKAAKILHEWWICPLRLITEGYNVPAPVMFIEFIGYKPHEH
jgi:hypothetical protein